MPTASIYNWITGRITARRAPGGRNRIITADEQQKREPARGGTARPAYTRARWAPPRQKPAKRRKKDKEGSREIRR